MRIQLLSAAALWGLLMFPSMGWAQPPKSAKELGEVQRTLHAVVKQVSPAVVRLEYDGGGGSSGVVFNESGLVLTHGHHTQDIGKSLAIHFPDGRRAAAVWEGVYRGNSLDWSIIRITDKGIWPFAPLRKSDELALGTVCFRIGFPAELTLRSHDDRPKPLQLLRAGQIIERDSAVVRASCGIVPGDSGGPLFDLEGRVIGLATAASCQGPVGGMWTRVSAITSGQLDQLASAATARKQFTRKAHPSTFAEPLNEVHQQVGRGTVTVMLNGKDVALGVVVKPQMILTKRSEILSLSGDPVGQLHCKLSDGSQHPATQIGDIHEHDLALLQCEGCAVKPVKFSDEVPTLGEIVASVGSLPEPATGVISCDGLHEIPPMQGNPGLPMAERGGQITVEKSGAIKDLPFDLKTMTLVGDRIRFGDIVTHVEGKEITDHASYAKIVEKAVGGDQLQLTILRSGKASSVYVPTSSTHPPIAQQYPVSYRRTGFPQVIRHDAVVDRNLCGGPVIDTAGRVVGINIARADIHQMLAIPSTTIQKLLEQLRAETKSQHE